MSGPLEVPDSAARLKSLLASRNLSPNRRFGQNFLIEFRVLDVIVRLAELSPADVVLEVGTGLGTLTRRLGEVASLVVSIEIDNGLYALARDLLGNQERVRLIHGDIMETKATLHTEACEKLDVALVEDDSRALKVVSNLPYNISTPFLTALILRFGLPQRMVLMVQRELAENLVAKPGSKSYSPLSILLQLLADVRVDRYLPRDVFWPKPQVESAIVVIDGNSEDAMPVLRAYPLIRFLFTERRKTIGSLLKKLPAHMGGSALTDETRAKVLESLELEGRERAESLDPRTFLAMEKAISHFTVRRS